MQGRRLFQARGAYHDLSDMVTNSHVSWHHKPQAPPGGITSPKPHLVASQTTHGGITIHSWWHHQPHMVASPATYGGITSHKPQLRASQDTYDGITSHTWWHHKPQAPPGGITGLTWWHHKPYLVASQASPGSITSIPGGFTATPDGITSHT